MDASAAIRLENARGTCVDLVPLGAAVAAIRLPGAATPIQVSVAAGGSAGKTIGRYANRIAGGRFVLDGVEHRLLTNENGNTLHGGPDGFSKRDWTVEQILTEGSRLVAASFALHSPDGDQGFPGALDVVSSYRLSEGDELRLDYTATADAPTVVNFTNHTYFNLFGDGSVADNELQIAAGAYTPLDENLIPTGEIAPVAGTRFDFRSPRAIGEEPYDVNFVLDGWDGTLRHAAHVFEPRSGRRLDVSTTQPGLQLYTGKPGAFALEAQHFADSPNHPNFPSTTLRPGQTFTATTVYRFSTTA